MTKNICKWYFAEKQIHKKGRCVLCLEHQCWFLVILPQDELSERACSEEPKDFNPESGQRSRSLNACKKVFAKLPIYAFNHRHNWLGLLGHVENGGVVRNPRESAVPQVTAWWLVVRRSVLSRN